MSNFHSLFNPQSIAIIGASTTPGSVGNDICKNLVHQGFEGKIYPINPHAQELYGLKCYPSVSAVEGQIDMAVVAVPATIVPSVLEEAGKKGVKAAVVISAGFREAGKDGELLEAQIKVISHKYNIALIGPNCLGLLNPAIKMNASFAAIMPPAGNIAFISQSGALCTSVLDYAKTLGIGFSKFISIGNKSCIDEIDLLEYLDQDEQTKVIIMYVEQITQASRFIETVRRITSGDNPTPIIILKAGRTTAGARASASHTGSLGSNDVFIDSIFKKAGVTRADTIEELFDFAISFSQNALLRGNRIAVVTNAGGPGVLTADEVVSVGLQLATPSPETENNLRSFLPPSANVNNPIDMIGDAKADRYQHTLKVVSEDPGVDGIIVILTPQTMTQVEETAKAIGELKKNSTKPIIACFMGRDSVEKGVLLLQQFGVATVLFPENAARSFAAMFVFADAVRASKDAYFTFPDIKKEHASDEIARASQMGRLFLPENQTRAILEAYGFPLLKSAVVHTPQEAAEMAKKMGGMSALKIVSPDIIHKSDVGGVKLHIMSEDAEKAYIEMMQTVKEKAPHAKLEGALMMQMAPPGGIEIILGASKDQGLGLTMMMLGMGGVFVEVFKDVTFAPIPATKRDITDMIARLNISKILMGTRGMKPYDIQVLSQCLGRLSQLIAEIPQINELDINPLMLYPEGQGAYVLDARIGL